MLGPQIYNLKFGPTYRVSYATSLAFLVGTVVSLLMAWWTTSRARKAQDVEGASVVSEGSLEAR